MENNSIQLILNDSNRVKVNLFGATITSWVCNNEEIIFVSEKAIYDGKKAIRGGIPVVFRMK
jgi:glucose-6-phosphate 1-epimerase